MERIVLSIVLDEISWAESVIKQKDLGKKPYETLTRVAKYYLHDGIQKSVVRKNVESFLLSCDPSASVVLWSGTIDSVMQNALKFPAVNIDEIKITKKEMDRIDGLKGKQIRRLAFTLLCISKYKYILSPQSDHWVTTPDNEIMSMANINTSIKRQSLMYSQLKDEGMIRFSKKISNLSVQVLFCDDDESDVVLTVTDFRNLGYQYMMYHGGPFFICKECGITEKYKDPNNRRNKKYCEDCAVKEKIRRSVNSVMRQRAEKM